VYKLVECVSRQESGYCVDSKYGFVSHGLDPVLILILILILISVRTNAEAAHVAMPRRCARRCTFLNLCKCNWPGVRGPIQASESPALPTCAIRLLAWNMTSLKAASSEAEPSQAKAASAEAVFVSPCSSRYEYTRLYGVPRIRGQGPWKTWIVSVVSEQDRSDDLAT
jgi:hypothetical protein